MTCWKLNKGNFVNRIGKARRCAAYSWCVAVIAIIVAIVGWIRPVNVIAERPVNNDCFETMCNN